MGYIERSSEVEELVNCAEELAATIAAVLEPDGNFKVRGQAPDSEILTRAERVQSKVRQVRDRLGYNGYRNHETWIVLVWLNSDEQRRQRDQPDVYAVDADEELDGGGFGIAFKRLKTVMERLRWS